MFATKTLWRLPTSTMMNMMMKRCLSFGNRSLFTITNPNPTMSKSCKSQSLIKSTTTTTTTTTTMFDQLPLRRLLWTSTVHGHGQLFAPHKSSNQHQQQAYIPFGSEKLQITQTEWEEDKFLYRLHKAGPKIRHKKRHPLENKPQMRGVVLKTLIRKPKKPNSANRKCVLIRLSNGKEATAFVPGEGHNLQEHSVVLVQKKRVRDVPGLKLRVIRGAYDCGHVVKGAKNL